mmetsp:Transcript_25146/g.66228  ORF Transcript_25146/g.66228 Transcript_25146/m.66228 type:complete len:339 (+) Transcript_25146:600-1616(+)
MTRDQACFESGRAFVPFIAGSLHESTIVAIDNNQSAWANTCWEWDLMRRLRLGCDPQGPRWKAQVSPFSFSSEICGHIQFNVTEKRTDTGDYRGDVRANLRTHQIFVRDWMLGYWTGRAPVMHSLAPTTALVCGQMKNGGAGKLPDPGTCGLPWGPGSTSEYIYPTDENVDAFVRKMREAAGQLQLLRSARSGAYEAPAGGGALSMIELMAVVATQPCTAEALAVTGAVRAATGAPPSLRSLLSTDAAELMPQLPHRRSGPEGAEMLDVLDVPILDPLCAAHPKAAVPSPPTNDVDEHGAQSGTPDDDGNESEYDLEDGEGIGEFDDGEEDNNCSDPQ